ITAVPKSAKIRLRLAPLTPAPPHSRSRTTQQRPNLSKLQCQGKVGAILSRYTAKSLARSPLPHAAFAAGSGVLADLRRERAMFHLGSSQVELASRFRIPGFDHYRIERGHEDHYLFGARIRAHNEAFYVAGPRKNGSQNAAYFLSWLRLRRRVLCRTLYSAIRDRGAQTKTALLSWEEDYQRLWDRDDVKMLDISEGRGPAGRHRLALVEYRSFPTSVPLPLPAYNRRDPAENYRD
ncbi:MAG TPA: hypothetical protein VFQ03_00305, partial [Candidatus Binatia bacterium]|nr:hypothetical protein [Candidatus Binatia bacterium]